MNHGSVVAPPSTLEQKCINTIRFLSVDAVQKANSGHPGAPMGAAPMAFVLWTRFLKHNPTNPSWFDRDRFVLSAGHASMLLYSLLHLTGYDLPLEEIQRFRQMGSKAPGHPERGVTPGVETTTGPLGQGFANAVGMAVAEAHLAAKYNRPGFQVVDHYTYCLASDGDLMEGVASEAASLAGHLKLGRLICLYDDNRVSLAASTDLTFTEDRAARFSAYGWHVETVGDGNDFTAITAAIAAARKEQQRPSLILIKTHIGFGSPNKQDSFEAHGSPLGADEVRLTKERLGWPEEPAFLIPEDVLALFRSGIERGKASERKWLDTFTGYQHEFPELAADFQRTMKGDLPDGWDRHLPSFPPDPKGMATRVASGLMLNAMAGSIPELIGGSADLNPSTHTVLEGWGDFESPLTMTPEREGSAGGAWGYGGRNIHFGVREHGMAAIVNGMAAHGGTIPFGSTFLTFSDYLRPALRLAALMELHVIHVFTHDSIGMGEDGPTHQPVEQLAALRAMPGLIVIRPGDANETVVAWQLAVNMRHRPVALVLSRQNLPILDRSIYATAEGARRGGYVVADCRGLPEAIIIATGSELGLAVSVYEALAGKGRNLRVVSLPSWEVYDEQPESYRQEVLPQGVVRIAVEAASPFGWERYVGCDGHVIGVDRFGTSAPGGQLLKEYGFTVEAVAARVAAILGRKGEPV